MKVYSAEHIRNWDAFTIEKEPISSVDLMERAATVCAKHIIGSFYFESAAVICGPGNNGGDGLVIARLLSERGVKTKVYLVEFGIDQSNDFKHNLARLNEDIDQVVIKEGDSFPVLEESIVVDAIFGSGLNRGIEGWPAKVVDWINAAELPTVSVDIPSGLFADQPMADNFTAVQATKTISFQCPKLSFFFPESDAFVGDWIVVDIGLHPEFLAEPVARMIRQKDIKLKQRNRSDHKGSNGFLSVIAGIGGMPGAALLASKAAYRTGCGYVATTAANDPSYSALLNYLPEALLIDGASLNLPKKTQAILIGPGIGTSTKAQEWVQLALESSMPAIWDADALNILAKHPQLVEHLKPNTILTPHIGELERLVGKQSDSLALLQAQIEFSKEHQVFVIQKGPNSKLSCPDGSVYINSTGNPGMATAGMGDVLSGMIGSFLAQGYAPKEAAINGIFIHGKAGDIVSLRQGQQGMISSDVADMIPEALQTI